jgi:2-oxoglutarate dehydrogenase complex dehydrogenase (E1) component-like enzyme
VLLLIKQGFAGLRNYSTGGTIHIIVNNQARVS